MLMVPNLVLHPAVGKAMFCVADLVAANCVWSIVSMNHDQRTGWPAACTALWLFNPLTIAVSTRGNADAVISVAVLLTLWWLRTERHVSAGVAYGIAVHLKLYPIIYALPTVFYLNPSLANAFNPSSRSLSAQRDLMSHLRGLVVPTRALCRFALGSLLSFGIANAASYTLYGWAFVFQTYLYHVTRTDHRHNFSPYFYPLYLMAEDVQMREDGQPMAGDAMKSTSSGWFGGNPTGGGRVHQSPMSGMVLGLAALVPQAALTAYAGFRFSDDLALAWLLQVRRCTLTIQSCYDARQKCFLLAFGSAVFASIKRNRMADFQVCGSNSFLRRT